MYVLGGGGVGGGGGWALEGVVVESGELDGPDGQVGRVLILG